jgi:hypothetical protein
MAHLESGYCTANEYAGGRELRQNEAELAVEGLYLMMFALDTTRQDQQAAKHPARVTGLEQHESGLRQVELSFLSPDLKPEVTAEAVFSDGYWQRSKSCNLWVGEHQVVIAYLKDYCDGVQDELHSLIENGINQEKRLAPQAPLEPVAS